MKACVLFNKNSGSAGQAGALKERCQQHPHFEVIEPGSADEAAHQVKRALQEGVEWIVAAGGDGTIHSIVNAMAPDFKKSRLAVVPLGTGNDFSRTLALPQDPLEVFNLIENGRTTHIDLIEVKSASQARYCINVAAGGFSGQMQEAMTDEMKSRWGPLAYLRGAAGVLPQLQNYKTFVQYDEGPREQVSVLNIIVANGRSSGKGIVVAPFANPEDGLMDVVLVKNSGFSDLVDVATRLLRGKNYIENDQVLLRKAQHVRVESEPGMWFSIDGELMGKEALEFKILPRAIEVLVGPEYSAVPIVEKS